MEQKTKKINAKVIHKCETEANWELSSYIPAEGEVVTYKIDENYDYERMKLGDGIHTVKDLPFVNDDILKLVRNVATDALTYELAADGTYAICTGLNDTEETVVIVANTYNNVPVTTIAANAFENCTNIISIMLPINVVNIEENAFLNCTSLVDIFAQASAFDANSAVAPWGGPENLRVYYDYDVAAYLNKYNVNLAQWYYDEIGGYTGDIIIDPERYAKFKKDFNIALVERSKNRGIYGKYALTPFPTQLPENYTGEPGYILDSVPQRFGNGSGDEYKGHLLVPSVDIDTFDSYEKTMKNPSYLKNFAITRTYADSAIQRAFDNFATPIVETDTSLYFHTGINPETGADVLGYKNYLLSNMVKVLGTNPIVDLIKFRINQDFKVNSGIQMTISGTAPIFYCSIADGYLYLGTNKVFGNNPKTKHFKKLKDQYWVTIERVLTETENYVRVKLDDDIIATEQLTSTEHFTKLQIVAPSNANGNYTLNNIVLAQVDNLDYKEVYSDYVRFNKNDITIPNMAAVEFNIIPNDISQSLPNVEFVQTYINDNCVTNHGLSPTTNLYTDSPERYVWDDLKIADNTIITNNIPQTILLTAEDNILQIFKPGTSGGTGFIAFPIAEDNNKVIFETKIKYLGNATQTKDWSARFYVRGQVGTSTSNTALYSAENEHIIAFNNSVLDGSAIATSCSYGSASYNAATAFANNTDWNIFRFEAIKQDGQVTMQVYCNSTLIKTHTGKSNVTKFNDFALELRAKSPDTIFQFKDTYVGSNEDTTFSENATDAVAVRKANQQIAVPLLPIAEADATSKLYVDECNDKIQGQFNLHEAENIAAHAEITEAYEKADEQLKQDISTAYGLADDALKALIDEERAEGDAAVKEELSAAYAEADETLHSIISDEHALWLQNASNAITTAYTQADTDLQIAMQEAYQQADTIIANNYKAADKKVKEDTLATVAADKLINPTNYLYIDALDGKYSQLTFKLPKTDIYNEMQLRYSITPEQLFEYGGSGLQTSFYGDNSIQEDTVSGVQVSVIAEYLITTDKIIFDFRNSARKTEIYWSEVGITLDNGKSHDFVVDIYYNQALQRGELQITVDGRPFSYIYSNYFDREKFLLADTSYNEATHIERVAIATTKDSIGNIVLHYLDADLISREYPELNTTFDFDWASQPVGPISKTGHYIVSSNSENPWNNAEISANDKIITKKFLTNFTELVKRTELREEANPPIRAFDSNKQYSYLPYTGSSIPYNNSITSLVNSGTIETRQFVTFENDYPVCGNTYNGVSGSLSSYAYVNGNELTIGKRDNTHSEPQIIFNDKLLHNYQKAIFETEIYFDLDNLEFDAGQERSAWISRIHFQDSRADDWLSHSLLIFAEGRTGVRFTDIGNLIFPTKTWLSMRIEQVGHIMTLLVNETFIKKIYLENVVDHFTGVSYLLRYFGADFEVKFRNTYVGTLDDAVINDGYNIPSVVERTKSGYIRVPAFSFGEEPSRRDTYIDEIAVPYKYVKSMEKALTEQIAAVTGDLNQALDAIIDFQNSL